MKRADKFDYESRKAAYWNTRLIGTIKEARVDVDLALRAMEDAEKAHGARFREAGGAQTRRNLTAAQRSLEAALESAMGAKGEGVLS